jgi:Zn-dependent M28 family amino/carboxypeptidase
MQNRAVVPFLFLAIAFVSCGGGDPAGQDSVKQRAADSIVAENLREHVTVLAGDAMEGRGPGSEGDRRARAYLAGRLAELGYEPLFEGSWEQPLAIVGVHARMPETWTFRGGEGGETSFRFAEEYMGASGVQAPEVAIEDAEVVFVGYGIVAPEEDWDDFKDVDVTGKVVVMLNDDPDWEPDLFAGERKLYYGRWDYKYLSAARRGAAGAIIIHTTPSAGYPWIVVRNSWMGEQFDVEAGDEPRTKLQAWLTRESAERLFALAGMDLSAQVENARSRDFRPVSLGVTTSIRFPVELRATETANVAGILRGSDPDLSGEVVVVSAHHDHLGIGEPDETGDRIFNGALDNGVAMAQALEVARGFTTLPERPRRSIVVFFPAAEEQGLIGSRYFAQSGAIHPADMVADVNFELGNVWGRTRNVTVFGMGKSTLEDVLAEVARGQGRTLNPEEDVKAGWFYRSDQFNFARVGVPAIWFRSGTDFIDRPEGWGEATYAGWIEEHYHRPSDEVGGDWNYEGLVEDARLGFLLVATVAQAEARPAWYPGDEFEEVRRRSLDSRRAGADRLTPGN